MPGSAWSECEKSLASRTSTLLHTYRLSSAFQRSEVLLKTRHELSLVFLFCVDSEIETFSILYVMTTHWKMKFRIGDVFTDSQFLEVLPLYNNGSYRY